MNFGSLPGLCERFGLISPQFRYRWCRTNQKPRRRLCSVNLPPLKS